MQKETQNESVEVEPPVVSEGVNYAMKLRESESKIHKQAEEIKELEQKGDEISQMKKIILKLGKKIAKLEKVQSSASSEQQVVPSETKKLLSENQELKAIINSSTEKINSLEKIMKFNEFTFKQNEIEYKNMFTSIQSLNKSQQLKIAKLTESLNNLKTENQLLVKQARAPTDKDLEIRRLEGVIDDLNQSKGLKRRLTTNDENNEKDLREKTSYETVKPDNDAALNSKLLKVFNDVKIEFKDLKEQLIKGNDQENSGNEIKTIHQKMHELFTAQSMELHIARMQLNKINKLITDNSHYISKNDPLISLNAEESLSKKIGIHCKPSEQFVENRPNLPPRPITEPDTAPKTPKNNDHVNYEGIEKSNQNSKALGGASSKIGFSFWKKS